MKLEKGEKPLTNSGNSSRPPSRDQKTNLANECKKHRHGPPHGHAKHEQEFVTDYNHLVEVRLQVCNDSQLDLSQESGPVECKFRSQDC